MLNLIFNVTIRRSCVFLRTQIFICLRLLQLPESCLQVADSIYCQTSLPGTNNIMPQQLPVSMLSETYVGLTLCSCMPRLYGLHACHIMLLQPVNKVSGVIGFVYCLSCSMHLYPYTSAAGIATYLQIIKFS